MDELITLRLINIVNFIGVDRTSIVAVNYCRLKLLRPKLWDAKSILSYLSTDRL